MADKKTKPRSAQRPVSSNGGLAAVRDNFAGQALRALIVGRDWTSHKGTDAELLKKWATAAWLLADEMMAARGG